MPRKKITTTPPYLIRDIMENKDYRFNIYIFLGFYICSPEIQKGYYLRYGFFNNMQMWPIRCISLGHQKPDDLSSKRHFLLIWGIDNDFLFSWNRSEKGCLVESKGQKNLLQAWSNLRTEMHFCSKNAELFTLMDRGKGKKGFCLISRPLKIMSQRNLSSKKDWRSCDSLLYYYFPNFSCLKPSVVLSREHNKSSSLEITCWTIVV